MLLLQMFGRTSTTLRRFFKQPCVLVSNQFCLSLSTSTTLRSAPSKGPSIFQYRLIEDVEDLDRYCPGGYHPLQIGDELNCGRYQLVDKLGYGGYSTIWLGRDLHRARYVALKVITASTTKPGSEVIPPLIDEFWITGPNGKHRCLVTSPAQMSLSASREMSTFGLFHPQVAQSIIAQLVRGVAFLHSKNIVHGDLHLGNILLQFPKALDSFSTSELYNKFGDPEPEPIVRVDGKPLSEHVPTHAFLRGWFGASTDKISLGDEKVLLSDFGESFNPAKETRFLSKTPLPLQPPETRFSDKHPLSFSSDIWTLACTIWEILGHRPLFETFFPNIDRVTKEQIEVLGPLPPEWWKKWDKSNVDLQPSTDLHGVLRTWDRRFEYSIQEARAEAGLEPMMAEEWRACKEMLRAMLAFRPEERATAQQVMQSEWMERWGLPALEQSWRNSSSGSSISDS